MANGWRAALQAVSLSVCSLILPVTRSSSNSPKHTYQDGAACWAGQKQGWGAAGQEGADTGSGTSQIIGVCGWQTPMEQSRVSSRVKQGLKEIRTGRSQRMRLVKRRCRRSGDGMQVVLSGDGDSSDSRIRRDNSADAAYRTDGKCQVETAWRG